MQPGINAFGILTSSGFLSAREWIGEKRQRIPVNIKIISLGLLSFISLFINNIVISTIHIENITIRRLIEWFACARLPELYRIDSHP
jgi:hypothetical protein